MTGTLGVCTATDTVTLTRPSCSATVNFYDSGYASPVKIYDVPIAYVGGIYSPVDTYGYIGVSDCDQNKDRYAQDSITVTLTGNSGEIDTRTLLETGNNTGIFRNSEAFTRNNWISGDGALYVYPGSYVTASFNDTKPVVGTYSKTIAMTGARQIRVTDSSNWDIWQVESDPYPYDASYPDGSNAFHVELNVPSFANNGIQNTVTLTTCALDPDDRGLPYRDAQRRRGR